MVLEQRFAYSRFGAVDGDRLVNVHERTVPGLLASSSEILESIPDPARSVWPSAHLPLVLDRGLEVGSTGGHGPIRYTVVLHEPGRRVRFAFTDDAPIRGYHEFVLAELPGVGVRWRHELVVEPVDDRIRRAIEPRHDEVLEALLDGVEQRVSGVPEM